MPDNLAEATVLKEFTYELRPVERGYANRTLYVNEQLIGDASWVGRHAQTLRLPFSQRTLSAITNTVRISETGPASDYVLIDAYALSYQSAFTATSDILSFSQPQAGKWRYTVGGFTVPQVLAFDVTDPTSVARLADTTLITTGATYTLSFRATRTRCRCSMAANAAVMPVPLVNSSSGFFSESSTRMLV